MHYIDWLILAAAVGIVVMVGFYARKYVRDVSDFLVAGRVGGRYVLAVAEGVAAMGLISIIGQFELYYNSGFAIKFWGNIGAPIHLLILLTGFAVYRFRETRAMTMSQFLEIRYSRKFRIFSGVLQAFAGITTYGIFPAIGARFLIYFCKLPLMVKLYSNFTNFTPSIDFNCY